jgi:Tol biopolymer transport system component
MTDDDFFLPPSEIISTAPAWSPDGTRIAYSVLEPGDDGGISSGGIWLMNADGSGKVQITDIVPDETAAAWSPDGSQLLFASGWTATQVPDIYIARADGSEVIQVTSTADAPEANPVWSPDGLQIVFSAYSEAGWDLFVANADGTDVTPVVSDDSETFAPDWSPDGSRIAFTSRPIFQGGSD